MSNKTIIKRIISECFGFKNNEQILIVHDDALKKLAEEFYNVTRTLKIESLLMRMAPRQLHGQEPPRAIASALKTADIAILRANVVTFKKVRLVASNNINAIIDNIEFSFSNNISLYNTYVVNHEKFQEGQFIN